MSAAWFLYRGNNNKLYMPLPNSSRVATSTTNASSWTIGASRASGDDIILLWEDKVRDAWTLEVDVFALNKLELTCGCEGQTLSLQTNACCDTLPSLIRSYLSFILSIITPHNQCKVENNQTHMKHIENQVKQCRYTTYGNALLYFWKIKF